MPARFAAQLLARALRPDYQPPKDFHAEIARQLIAWQSGFYGSFSAQGFHATTFGPYQAAESNASWFNCWAQTNAGDIPKPRAQINTTRCSTESDLFIAEDLSTGSINITHEYITATNLNAFQFAMLLSRQDRAGVRGGTNKKWHTRQRCYGNFMAASPEGKRLPLYAVWCARAYRNFDGLYDIAETVVTQDDNQHALLSEMMLEGVTYETAVTLGKSFVEAIRWAK